MKNPFKILLLFFTILLVSCNSSPEKNILGSWKCNQLKTVFFFVNDNTGTMVEFGKDEDYTLNITWKFQDEFLYINSEELSIWVRYKFSDNLLILETPNDPNIEP